MRHTDPMPSRSPGSPLFGKRTHDKRTKVSDETNARLPAKWRGLGYQTEAHYLADLIEIAVIGIEHVESVQRERLRAVVGMGPEKGE